MFGDLDIKNLFYRFFDRLDPWIAEFDHFAIFQDHVIVLPVKIGLFVMCLIFPKLMFANQAALQQQFYGIVERRATNAIFFILM